MSQTALKSDTLHENLVRELSRMAPGEKFMTVRDIMRRYNVSQLIVDRAVNRLCEDGKLVSFARRGLFVPQFVRPTPAEQPTLLVAVPDWVSPDIDEIKAELERLAPLHPETRLLLHRFDYRYAIPPELPLAAENVRQLLMMPGRVDTLEARDIEALNIFRKNGPVMVLCHHLNNFNVPSVGLDDMFAGNCAAHHLYHAGHRKIAVLMSEPQSSVILDRVNGVLNYARLHGMQAELIDCEIPGGEVPLERVYRKMSRIIEQGFDFTALAGVSGDSLAGALNACHNHGLAIPAQLSIVTIGNLRTTELFYPPLDTICVGIGRQVSDAVEQLLAGKNESVLIPPELVKRGSVRIISESSNL